jgi:hypothetical protein
MSRIKRVLAILPAVVLLIIIVPNWGSSLRDLDPIPIVLPVLLVLLLLCYLVRFSAIELLGVLILTIPALFVALHAFCGLTVGQAYLMILRSTLAVIFYFLVSLVIETSRSRKAASISRPAAAFAVALLWALVLLGRNILFSLSLAILAGLLLFYRRSLQRNG